LCRLQEQVSILAGVLIIIFFVSAIARGELEFSATKYGNQKLTYKGYAYSNKEKGTWRCTRHSSQRCNGRLVFESETRFRVAAPHVCEPRSGWALRKEAKPMFYHDFGSNVANVMCDVKPTLYDAKDGAHYVRPNPADVRSNVKSEGPYKDSIWFGSGS